MSNMISLGNSEYICYTQAGFKKALIKEVYGNEKPYPNRFQKIKESFEKNMVFPTSYPCYIIINEKYNGGAYDIVLTYKSIQALNDILDRLKIRHS